jgi:hypothetical protein
VQRVCVPARTSMVSPATSLATSLGAGPDGVVAAGTSAAAAAEYVRAIHGVKGEKKGAAGRSVCTM